MAQVITVYCDESCHLEHDQLRTMVIGAVWCPVEKAFEAARRLREIKRDYGLIGDFELKWTKVSPAQLTYYMAVLDYFYDNEDLHFRAVVIPDKSALDHARFDQTHEDWYYKMYFTMLKSILTPDAQHRIYLDYKDQQGNSRVKKLHEVLCNSAYDFSRHIVERFQLVRSHEVELIQLTDMLIGAVGYANRLQNPNPKYPQVSPAKLALVNRMRERSHYKLTISTLLSERKTNLLVWRSGEGKP